MRRLHLFEVHDLPWCPPLLRTTLTDLLRMGTRWLGVYEGVVPLLERLVAGEPRIVDLCSGSGGPWEELHPLLERALGRPVRVTLTDKFPAVAALEQLARTSPGIRFEPASVDATATPPHLDGARTLFSSFHHFPPELARGILRDAAERGAPIGVFEGNQRTLTGFVAFLAIPAAVWVMTPFLRPWSWRRAFWTYAVPVFPLVFLWDGVVSNLRAYTPRELDELAAGIDVPGYRWESGRVPATWTRPSVTFLLGLPAR